MKPEELQKLYGDNAARMGCFEGEDESSNRFKKLAALMEAHREPCKVLDVGCASGTLLKPYTQKHTVIGIDISLALAQEALRNGYREVTEVDVSTQPLPFADKSFDVVFCGECIEHIVDTDFVFCEINRVLKPGGQFIVTFPNIRTPMSVLMMLFFNLPPMLSARYRSCHVRDFTTGTMRLALKNGGFRIESMQGSDFFFHKIGHFLPGLATHLPSWACTVVVSAYKDRDAAYSVEAVADHLIFKDRA